jgi:hypothetical protein
MPTVNVHNDFTMFKKANQYFFSKVAKEPGIDLDNCKLCKMVPDEKTYERLHAVFESGRKNATISVEGGKLVEEKGWILYKDFKSSFIILGSEGGHKRVFDSMWRHYESMYKALNKKPLELESAEVNFNEMRSDWNAQTEYQDSKLAINLYTFQKRYGYSCVYYNMYSALLKRLKEENDRIRVHVLSIGCGNKTDAIGLQYALEDFDGFVTKTKYVGIDPVQWNTDDTFAWLNEDDEFILLSQPPKGSNAKEFFVSEEIVKIRGLSESLNEFDAEGEKSVYFVVFPNSISEISKESVEDLMDAIRDTYRDKETYILASRNLTESMDQAQIDVIGDNSSERIIQCLSQANGNFHMGRDSVWANKSSIYPDVINEENDVLTLFDELTLASGSDRAAFLKKYEELYKKEWQRQHRFDEPAVTDADLDKAVKEEMDKKKAGLDADDAQYKSGAKTYRLAKSAVLTQKFIRYEVFRL